MSNSEQDWARDLAAKTRLELDPTGLYAIKRDAHNVDVNAPAADFAKAFHETMKTKGEFFGCITVRRPEAEVNQDFQVGHRFQGRYSIKQAVMEELEDSFANELGPVVGAMMSAGLMRPLLRLIEDNVISDYGEIVSLELENTDVYTLRYAYLEGSPIAGSSTFTIRELTPGTCRLTQVFEYQEANFASMASLGTWALKLHNEVVYFQVKKSAERIGAEIIASDIPEAYWQD